MGAELDADPPQDGGGRGGPRRGHATNTTQLISILILD